MQIKQKKQNALLKFNRSAVMQIRKLQVNGRNCKQMSPWKRKKKKKKKKNAETSHSY